MLTIATHMPGFGEVFGVLFGLGMLAGLFIGGTVVGIVAATSRKRRRAGYLIKLGLIIAAAVPLTVCLFAFFILILFG